MNLIKRNWHKSILAIVFVVMFLQYEHRAPKRNFSDFHVFYVTAKRLINNEPIYTSKGGLAYYRYPLLYAFILTPLTYLSELNAARIWFLLNLFFLCLIFYLSRKIIAPQDKDYSIAGLYFLTALASFRFILENLHEGQANLFMLALLLCSLYFILNRKETWGSFFLAGSIMLKYMPVLFLPYFLFKKRLGLIIKTVFFIIILTLLPAVLVGLARVVLLLKQQIPFLFSGAMDDYSTACYPNQSLLACLNRFFYEKSWFSVKVLSLNRENVLIIFFLLAIFIYLFTLIRRGKEKFSLVSDFALVILCMALFNPNAWKNFFVFIIFPYMVIIYYLLKIAGKDRFVFVMLIASFVLNSLTSEFFVKRWAGDRFEVYSTVTFGTLILFITLVKLKLFPKLLEKRNDAGH